MIDVAGALLSVTLPWLLFIVPGLLFFDRSGGVFAATARILMGGLAVSTLFFSLVVTLHLGLLVALLAGLPVAIAGVVKLHGKALQRHRYIYLGVLVGLLLVYGLYSLPFLLFHDGLPTGDAQKAIYWGQVIVAQQHWPDYTASLTQLNRDPVDFYTPGLHAVTAALLTATPGLLTSIGFLSIAAAIAVAVEAAALTRLFLPGKAWWWSVLAFMLVLSHERFLRYVREPGYHLQNGIGEVLLWGLVLLALTLMKRWSWRDALLGTLAGIALVLSHQFSSFLAVFMLVAMTVAFAGSSPALLKQVWTTYRRYAVAAIGFILCILIAGLFSSLASKLPALFTRTPHLLNLLPSPATYANLANPLFLFAGIAGWVALIFHHFRHKLSSALAISFVAGGVVIMLLSIGPLLGIDIPPVRALFYSVVPLACGVVFLLAFSATALKPFGKLIVTVTVLGFCWAGIAQAFTLSHTVRTNATLSAGQQFLIDRLGQARGGIVADEYNRASVSWLLLTHQPTFMRIAADLRQQMNEAGQSAVRNRLYMNQLDFEKIYNLGSSPLVATLMKRHGLAWVVGVDNATNNALSHNPALEAVWSADDLTAYRIKQAASLPASPWLLEPSTIVRTFGSDEDTFEHVPVSVAGTRLRFNIGDFVRVLWDKNNDSHPDMPLRHLNDQRKASQAR